MTRALITGVGGQDGSYLAERLVADGVEVHALVLDEGRRPPYCPSEVTLHVGDLADVEATRIELKRLVVDINRHLQRLNDITYDEVEMEIGGSE